MKAKTMKKKMVMKKYRAYYNEIDPYCCQWLRNLMAAGLIMEGDVDERSIEDVTPGDLTGYRRCHFFAGIAGWDYALTLAGWEPNRPIWTGSCPCQPFSQAGQRAGTTDERHLWPAWFHLITECHPPTLIGEQVASTPGLSWLDLVHADLEGAGYTVGAVDLPACGVGAPHIRQWLYFVAHAPVSRRTQAGQYDGRPSPFPTRPEQCGGDDELAHHQARRRDKVDQVAGGSTQGVSAQGRERPDGGGGTGKLGITNSRRWQTGNTATPPVGHGSTTQPAGGLGHPPRGGKVTIQQPRQISGTESPGEASRPDITTEPGLQRRPGDAQGQRARAAAPGFWDEVQWIACRDGKARPALASIQPLVDGLSFRLGAGGPFEGKSRVGMLRAAGNAIVPPLAAEFILAYLNHEEEAL
jgi:DNA (cytosine-5)-methyltransferase 1